ncbi:hypothetical protein IWQ62_004257 [Dispira parvispora]|uniref:Tyrosinase copper-binding domain-containing protein n=1 Tax=Dispira parvispora TaxID=1520584 RepID=A0A9W8AST2_9FUNG|nr:hypothetical protein IWQ62_004257 [Dispira parvispora]
MPLPKVCISQELYAKLCAMGGSLIPKQGILYGSLDQTVQPNAQWQVVLRVKGFAPFSHSDRDLATVLNNHLGRADSTVLGWYSAPAVNVPTDNLTPREVAQCYFDMVESTLLKILLAQCLRMYPQHDRQQLVRQLADEAVQLFRRLAGIVVWLPCMTPTDKALPAAVPSKGNPHFTVSPNAKRDPSFIHHHTSVDVYTYFSHTVLDTLLFKLGHPTCITQEDPVETRVLRSLCHQAGQAVGGLTSKPVHRDTESNGPDPGSEKPLGPHDTRPGVDPLSAPLGPAREMTLSNQADQKESEADNAAFPPAIVTKDATPSSNISGALGSSEWPSPFGDTSVPRPAASASELSPATHNTRPAFNWESASTLDLRPRVLHSCGLQVISADATAYIAAVQKSMGEDDISPCETLFTHLDPTVAEELRRNVQQNHQNVQQRLTVVEEILQRTLPKKIDQYQRAWMEHNALVDLLQFLDSSSNNLEAQLTTLPAENRSNETMDHPQDAGMNGKSSLLPPIEPLACDLTAPSTTTSEYAGNDR